MRVFFFSGIIICCAAVFILTGCQSDKAQNNKTGAAAGDSAEAKVFSSKTIKGDQKVKFKSPNYAKIKLELVSPKRLYYAGQTAKLVYKLSNRGRKKLTLLEWRRNEVDNVALYYHIYDPKLKRFDPKKWKCIRTPDKERSQLNALSLNPGNSVLINVELPFIEKIKPEYVSTEGIKFYIVCTLTMDSVKAHSRPEVITVRRKINKKVKVREFRF